MVKKEFKQIYTCLNTLRVGQVPTDKVAVGSRQENHPQISLVEVREVQETDLSFAVLEQNLLLWGG